MGLGLVYQESETSATSGNVHISILIVLHAVLCNSMRWIIILLLFGFITILSFIG